MTSHTSRRSFLASAPLAAFALPCAEAQTNAAPEPFRLFAAGQLQASAGTLKAAAGNDTLFRSANVPLTIVQTVETAKAAKEFEWHEGRDHVVQIVEGSTTYELGGSPQGSRNTKPMEWLATGSDGAQRLELRAGDMLVIPRGTPHRRTTRESVTFLLISAEGTPRT